MLMFKLRLAIIVTTALFTLNALADAPVENLRDSGENDNRKLIEIYRDHGVDNSPSNIYKLIDYEDNHKIVCYITSGYHDISCVKLDN